MKDRKLKSRILLSTLIFTILSLFTSCDWNLYTSTGMITPHPDTSFVSTIKSDTESFNLLSIAPEGIPSTYRINAPYRSGTLLLKGQDSESAEYFIEYLSYLKRNGKLEEALNTPADESAAEAVRGTLSFIGNILSEMSSSISDLDEIIRECLAIIAGVGIDVPEITFFADMATELNALEESLDKEVVTRKDYVALQYYINILSSIFQLSVPVINIVSDSTGSLTLEDIERLVSGDGITSELEESITKTLQENSSTLAGVLLDALSLVDQTGRIVKDYIPELPDISGIIALLSKGAV